jgi:hypothetical protein
LFYFLLFFCLSDWKKSSELITKLFDLIVFFLYSFDFLGLYYAKTDTLFYIFTGLLLTFIER